MKRIFVLLIGLCLVTALWAHPHFRKTITVEMAEGVTAKISYGTTPANETHAQNAQVGAFVTPRGPRLNLSGDLMVGSTKIAAGDYTIGVIKNGANDWTMALYPGRVGRGQTPDASKLIKLDSMYSGDAGMSEHMQIDIIPGHGKLAGKMVLSLEFGSMTCHGALS